MYTAYFKHKKHGHVITHHDLVKLPVTHHNNWEETEDKPTHHFYNDDDNGSGLLGLSLGVMAAEAIFDNSSDNNNYADAVPVDNSPSVDFGGGDFGGGGSSGDY